MRLFLKEANRILQTSGLPKQRPSPQYLVSRCLSTLALDMMPSQDPPTPGNWPMGRMVSDFSSTVTPSYQKLTCYRAAPNETTPNRRQVPVVSAVTAPSGLTTEAIAQCMRKLYVVYLPKSGLREQHPRGEGNRVLRRRASLCLERDMHVARQVL